MKWQGHKFTEEKTRACLEQVLTHVNQRLLFKLLQNIRLVTDLETRENSLKVEAYVHVRNLQSVSRSEWV